jgi:hypothetical protein
MNLYLKKISNTKFVFCVIYASLFLTVLSHARDTHQNVDASTIAAQNAAPENNTNGKGYGPQSPGDLTLTKGTNKRVFNAAPSPTRMNLCSIHFHQSAEHKGGEFISFAGLGDGHGYATGFKYAASYNDMERPTQSPEGQGTNGCPMVQGQYIQGRPRAWSAQFDGSTKSAFTYSPLNIPICLPEAEWASRSFFTV